MHNDHTWLLNQDYIGLDDMPKLKALVGRKAKVEFAETVKQIDRGYKGVSHLLVVSASFRISIDMWIVNLLHFLRPPVQGVPA